MVKFDRRLGVTTEMSFRRRSLGPSAFLKFWKNSAIFWNSRFWHHRRKARSPRVRPAVLFLGLCFCASVSSPVFAQAIYGSIFGTITDQSGAAVVGAKVTVTSVQKGTQFQTTTNETGNYTVTHLIPDQYNVRASGPGFKTLESRSIPVYADQAARVDSHFQVGAAEEIVTVSAEEVPLLKTDRADVATTFTERQVKNLPLYNRNFTLLELLTPGTTRAGFQHSSAENPQGSSQIMVNGQHFGETSYQLDGTDNRDPILGIIVINPTLESIAETKITSQNYDAEFGQALGGVVTAQTKSGTKTWHGSMFEFRRTGWGQARNPFLDPPDRKLPPIKWNQFGASIGGPLVTKKLFVFGDYQGTRRRNGASLRLDVPTALVHSTCLNPNVPFCDLSEYQVPIFDPASDNTVEFANQQIPRDRISPQAVALLKLIPEPNVPGAGVFQNFIASGIAKFADDNFNIRVDHNTTERLRIFGRYSFADFRQDSAGAFGKLAGGPAIGSDLAGQSFSRNQSIAVGSTYVLSPSLITDFRFGFFRYHVNVLQNGRGMNPAADAGIPGLNLGDLLTSGMPFVDIDGFTFGNICNCPLLQTENQFQWVNNWTKTAGNHILKWGADIRYAQNFRFAGFGPRVGGLIFEGGRTQGPDGGGLGLATFFLGDVSKFGRYVNSKLDAGERQKRWFFYGQDTYRITRKLTMNYGLRWEIYFPQSVTGKGAGGWVDFNTGLVSVAGYGDINLQGNVKNSFHNFAPRLGIAYQVTPKTVVRLGYGRSFDIGVFGSVFGHSVTQNLPVLANQQLHAPSNTGSVFDLATGPPPANFIAVPASGKFLLPDQVGVSVLPSRMRLPTLDAWNVTVQHQITPTLSLEAGYVANKGTHVFAGNNPRYDVNQPSIVGFGTLSRDERKPFFKKFGWTQEIGYLANDASDNYNSLQVKVEKRFSKAYQLLAHYTWSRALNHNDDYYAIDPKVNYGVADQDRKHVFVLANMLDLPFGKGKSFFSKTGGLTNRIVGGWSLNATAFRMSGLPFSPSYAFCGADIDTGPCRPNLVGRVHITGKRTGYFTTTNDVFLEPNGTPGDTIGPWQRPAAGTFGSAGRNSLRGPGLFQSDLSVVKSISLKETASVQFRADIFNVFNVVNLANPLDCVDCIAAGRIIGTASGQRQMMFSLRLQF